MSHLHLDNLQCTYDRTVAVRHLDLRVAQGELLALLGPSGCGKSTTLRMVAGFVPPSAGRILFGERDVTHAPPHAPPPVVAAPPAPPLAPLAAPLFQAVPAISK